VQAALRAAHVVQERRVGEEPSVGRPRAAECNRACEQTGDLEPCAARLCDQPTSAFGMKQGSSRARRTDARRAELDGDELDGAQAEERRVVERAER
jgi:hypothetical protein